MLVNLTNFITLFPLYRKSVCIIKKYTLNAVPPTTIDIINKVNGSDEFCGSILYCFKIGPQENENICKHKNNSDSVIPIIIKKGFVYKIETLDLKFAYKSEKLLYFNEK